MTGEFGLQEDTTVGQGEMQLSPELQNQMDSIRKQLGETLDAITDDLASDISREQEHLMLMQDQVDKQKHMLQKDLGELSKKLEQERMQRGSAQSSMNDSLQMLRNAVAQRDTDIEDLEARLLALENRSTLWGFCTFRAATGRAPRLSFSDTELAEPLALRQM
eukprot:CAMPEP_0177754300 /NCGR_PEP_ID=MMETSP0491_2-20121128/1935_1 /TAXON_ID=63592 /ORGANISM="Tetraselmis chuii, Strain PLY429" /LENGTH=162 /DNA_ID=CAMNT_0019269673 /DNA_START=112 /DNA_END=600 /DNA_ORIENTATION=+